MGVELKLLPIDNPNELYSHHIEQDNWNKLIEEVKRLRPGLSNDIDTMLTKVLGNYWRGDGFDLMAQQKDAIQIAFNCTFDTKEKRLDYKLPNPGQKPKDILKCFPNEDSCIYHDMLKFGYWHEIQGEINPISRTFKHGKKVLKITNVNRTKIEKTLGIDLIYYNHGYQAFIMVQYKLWQQSSGKYFYRADNQYDKDIERIKNAGLLIDKESNFNLRNNAFLQRINESPFYFKLCKPTELSYNNEMIGGSYIHYSYLDRIMQLRLGERGGRVVFENQLLNDINNQLFIDLIKNGLIGSIGIDNTQLNKMVEYLLNQGNSVMLAESFKL